MGGRRLQLLTFDFADIQHKTDDTPLAARADRLPLNPIPRGRPRVLRRVQTRNHHQVFAVFNQLIKTNTELIAIGRMKQRQPGFAG